MWIVLDQTWRISMWSECAECALNVNVNVKTKHLEVFNVPDQSMLPILAESTCNTSLEGSELARRLN